MLLLFHKHISKCRLRIKQDNYAVHLEPSLAHNYGQYYVKDYYHDNLVFMEELYCIRHNDLGYFLQLFCLNIT